jgi:hypothetical protein
VTHDYKKKNVLSDSLLTIGRATTYVVRAASSHRKAASTERRRNLMPLWTITIIPLAPVQGTIVDNEVIFFAAVYIEGTYGILRRRNGLVMHAKGKKRLDKEQERKRSSRLLSFLMILISHVMPSVSASSRETPHSSIPSLLDSSQHNKTFCRLQTQPSNFVSSF